MNVQVENILNFISWNNIQKHFKIIVGVLSSVCLVFIITLIAIVSIKNEAVTKLEDEKPEICFKPGCVEIASNIISNMDSSVDPCMDFYNFACGNFMKNTHIRADQFVASSFQDVQKSVYYQLRSLLDEPSPSTELRPFVLTKNFYKACTNTTAIEKDGLITIKTILGNLNGWPVIEGQSWYDAKFDWKQAMFALRSTGFTANYLIKVDVITDLKNSSLRVISLDQAEFGINRRNLIKGFDDNTTQSYYRYMIDVAVMFGANQSQAIEELKESLEFEMELAKIALSPSQREDKNLLYNPITVAKLQIEYPNSNWKKYIKYLLDIQEFQISDDDTVVLRIPEYVNKLENLVAATSKRAQANYIMWRVVLSTVRYLNQNLRKRRLIFYKEIYGEQRQSDLWKECMFDTMRNFWESVTNLYLRKHSHSKAKRTITDMFTKIGKSFLKLIQKSRWMDNETKQHAFDKAIGLPYYTTFSHEMDDKALVKFYSTLNFNSDNYLRSILDVWLFKSNNHFKKLREPVTNDDRKWDISLVYQIGVPHGLFQGAFFNTDRPNYANYGAVGSIIGHVTTHVFDDHGRQFNKDLELSDWWLDSTKQAFRNISQCVVDQYGNFTISETGWHLDGKQTLTENIADIVGLKVAYLAYSDWSKRNKPEPLLPGLNFTQNQLFWLSNANMWCTKYRVEYLKYLFLVQPSSPAYYRITGSLQNLPYFSQDYNCSAKSKMNRQKKCTIW